MRPIICGRGVVAGSDCRVGLVRRVVQPCVGMTSGAHADQDFENACDVYDVDVVYVADDFIVPHKVN